MKVLRFSSILLHKPGTCYLLTLREGKQCHLIHSCHKNIQDSLCFQFSNRKDGKSCTVVPHNYFFLMPMEFLPGYCVQLIDLSAVQA